MDELLFYSYCYKDAVPENGYQLVLIKNIYQRGEVIAPTNEELFGQFLQLLLKGKQNSAVGDPLFSQSSCLEHHYLRYAGNKRDFIRYTKRMYLDSVNNAKKTLVFEDIHQEIMSWFSEKEKLSSIYEETIRKINRASEEEAQRMRIPVGTLFTSIPVAESDAEAWERLQNMTGMQYKECLVEKLAKKYALLDVEILEDELNHLEEFINEAVKKSRKVAFERTDQDPMNEYLRLKHSYYLNHRCNYTFGGIASIIFGEYFLFKQWLMEELRKVKESSTGTSNLGVHLPAMQLSSGLVKNKVKRAGQNSD
ncbi:MAG: hypothetical protein EON51_01935 [Acinetobacter sp.]|nr:MAG: hypothetical protein EON51_01935 [Acinetobacter sp.]